MSKKKILALLLAVSMLISFTACGGSEDASDADTDTEASSVLDDDDDLDSDSSEEEDELDSSSKVEYKDVEGLEPMEMVEVDEDYNETDAISGKIKDFFYMDGYYVILDEDSNVWLYQKDGWSYNVKELAEDTELTKIDDGWFENDAGWFTVLIRDDNTVFFKIIDAYTGEVVTDETTGVDIDFTTTVFEGKELSYFRFVSVTDIEAIDSDGNFLEGENRYWDKESVELDGDEVFADTEKVYEESVSSGSASAAPEGVTVTQLASTALLSSDGKLYFHSWGSTCADEEPIEATADITFTQIFPNDNGASIGSDNAGAIAEDGAPYIIDTDSGDTYTYAIPDGSTVEKIYTYSTYLLIKTSSGYFGGGIEDGELQSMSWLDEVDSEIVKINADAVLLSDGCMYEIGY